jgi:hypothetical protein
MPVELCVSKQQYDNGEQVQKITCIPVLCISCFCVSAVWVGDCDLILPGD